MHDWRERIVLDNDVKEKLLTIEDSKEWEDFGRDFDKFRCNRLDVGDSMRKNNYGQYVKNRVANNYSWIDLNVRHLMILIQDMDSINNQLAHKYMVTEAVRGGANYVSALKEFYNIYMMNSD